MELKKKEQKLYVPSFVGGGIAGLTVDIVLFPLDTLKTRLQAEQGFHKAGGFNGIYKGIGPQAVGSAPQAALFFVTYESIKHYLEPSVPKYGLPAVHMASASIAEVVACLIRVPIEVVKQRRQTYPGNKSSMKIALSAYKHEGLRKGLYRGFSSTVLREIPFSAIQFSILEYLKSSYRKNYKNNIPLESYEVAVCGSIAGGFAAAVTTPLDVAKTRIMLADRKLVRTGQVTIGNTLRRVYASDGLKGLFSGFIPRVMWITIGGYIFFAVHEKLFIIFIISSLGHMLACINSTKTVAELNKDRNDVLGYLRLKEKLFKLSVVSTIGLIAFFVQHRLLCHRLAFSMFALCEYIIALANMAFHVAVILDLPTENFLVANRLSDQRSEETQKQK